VFVEFTSVSNVKLVVILKLAESAAVPLSALEAHHVWFLPVALGSPVYSLKDWEECAGEVTRPSQFTLSPVILRAVLYNKEEEFTR